ncbi:hypothetical protein MY4038_009968 [Beauveria bassiana]
MSEQIEAVATAFAAVTTDDAPAPAPAAAEDIFCRPQALPTNSPVDLSYRDGWEDDEEDPNGVIHRINRGWHVVENYWKERGYPCLKIVEDEFENDRFEPMLCLPPSAKNCPATAAEAEVEFLVMEKVIGPARKDTGGPADALVTYHLAGKDSAGTKRYTITVPRDKVEEHLEAGWKLKFGVPCVYAGNDKYGDDRARPEVNPNDIFTTDNPAADTERFLELGNKIASQEPWTRGKWKSGDLIGKNGANPDIKVQTASKIPSKQWKEWKDGTEKRTITSVGHVHHHQRPADAGVGWGDYDQVSDWQSHGRRVTDDMLVDRSWCHEPGAALPFVNEDGTPALVVPEWTDEHDRVKLRANKALPLKDSVARKTKLSK